MTPVIEIVGAIKLETVVGIIDDETINSITIRITDFEKAG